ncbi:50S ribosomal protein L28 [Negadavirga shengliensis]|jgi:large subunit ribosomal protein L28|uniref:Large ribosomal subunit protein bL28 n=1 Tax=Negadavirga shengliensis TaxID=1389218 RepID=A0ABV9T205_9BACT
MAKICDITGKRPRVGNNVSHANNKTKRRFYPNLHKKSFFIPEENAWITLKVSSQALRTINKKGITAVLKEAQKKGDIIIK